MKIFIIHGYDSSPNKNWFVWLKNKLEKKFENIQIHIPALPNPATPNVNLWLDCLQKECEIDEETYFIAHSLGCITTLLFLQKMNVKIAGFILVSGFEDAIIDFPQLRAFTDIKLNHQALINLAPKRLIIAANDDTIVPCSFSFSLAKNLKSNFIMLEKGNHFMTSDGFNSLPVVFKKLNKFIKNKKIF